MTNKEKLNDLRGKYWFSHQSPKTCLIGSDGVGHDLIHDSDKLQAACRNAKSHVDDLEYLKEELALKEIEIDELEFDLSQDMPEFQRKRLEIELKRTIRMAKNLRDDIQEKEVTVKVYMDHVTQLHEKVKDTYPDYDSALDDIWMARLIYNAHVKFHPLGNELKVALLDENKKAETLDLMGFIQETVVDGKIHKIQTPNADNIIKKLSETKKELSHG